MKEFLFYQYRENFHPSVILSFFLKNQIIKYLYPGWQPHGIAVDDDNNMVYVSNRNINSNGPPPHHSTYCGGRNGYVSIIDINTLSLLNVHLSDGRRGV